MVCAHRALQALGAREVRNVTAGHVFVVAVATLVGGLLCTFEHVLSDGTHTGVALKLRRGLSTPRYIFIPHQMQTQIELATSLTMLREVATNNKQGSRTRWRWFQDDDDSLTRFRTKARKLGKAHHSEVVSLLFNVVTRADALSNRYRISNLPCKMRLRDFKNLGRQLQNRSHLFQTRHLPATAPLSQGRTWLAKDETQCCA